jgi:bifunctional DNase/RNase
MEDRIQLRVMGISYSQTQSGAYALILAQAGGPVRIPVVIGASEAQSIAMRMEGITPPRPLTHDLMANMTRAFGIALKEVFIYKFEDGVFSSEMKFIDMDREVTLDSRTSDAIALAMRVGAPIFTTREIMEETGFVLEETSEGVIGSSDKNETAGVSQSPRMPDAEEFSIEQLEATLSQLIEREEYEEASRISEILKRKRGKNHKKE